MTTPTIAAYLKYANLQMAAEAFLVTNAGVPKTGTDYVNALTTGNLHASKFTDTLTTDFVAHWKVVDQKANTPTGFSGTLFQCIQDDPATGAKAGELVLSFRSTEFIDDAARDSKATNELEIKERGWAFGQLSDMESWYQSLQGNGKITGSISVTGYSLGGHLATAFNLRRNNWGQTTVIRNPNSSHVQSQRWRHADSSDVMAISGPTGSEAFDFLCI